VRKDVPGRVKKHHRYKPGEFWTIKNPLSFSFTKFPFSVLFAKSLITSSPICAFIHPPSVLFKNPWRLISFPSLNLCAIHAKRVIIHGFLTRSSIA